MNETGLSSLNEPRSSPTLSQRVVTGTVVNNVTCSAPARARAGTYHHSTMRTIPELHTDAIRDAHARIHPAFRNSAQYVNDALSSRLGVPVIVKVETANPIRSFKGRGRSIAVAALQRERRKL